MWINELYNNTLLGMKVKEVLYKKQSKYQLIEIVDTYDWGRVLMLDGCMMTSDKDEHFYHESITHLVMSQCNNAKNVLVIGGGDGGTLREVAKYSQVQSIDLVEIDEDVINACKEYIPQTGIGYTDPRVNVYAQDAFEFLKLENKQNYYDVIICDGSDPVGFAEVLIQDNFYSLCKQAMTEQGIFITQSGSPLAQPEEHELTKKNLAQSFKHTKTAWSLVPIYPGSYWSFTMASDNVELSDTYKNSETPANCKFWNEKLLPALLLN